MSWEEQNVLLLCHCRQQGVKAVRNQVSSWRQLFLIWSNWADLCLMCRAEHWFRCRGVSFGCFQPCDCEEEGFFRLVSFCVFAVFFSPSLEQPGSKSSISYCNQVNNFLNSKDIFTSVSGEIKISFLRFRGTENLSNLMFFFLIELNGIRSNHFNKVNEVFHICH